MATWAEFVADAPEVAAVASRLWPGVMALDSDHPVTPGGTTFAIAYLATVRPDGAPRLHPFCPIIAAGRLFAVSHHPLFEFDLQRVDVSTWVDIGQPGTHVIRHRWSAR